MKRWLLAVAVLLCGALSVSNADYLIIKYNLSATRDKNQEGQPAGQPGFGPGPGGVGLAGGAGPGIGPQAGFGNQGGQGGSAPPQGIMGAAGPRGGGGPMMMPGGPRGGGGGGMQMMGQQGFGQAATAAEDDVEITPLYVVAIVELQKPIDKRQLAMQEAQSEYAFSISHKWGTTWLKKSDSIVYFSMEEEANRATQSISKVFEKRFNDTLRQKQPENLIELADWALGHGLIAEFHKVMDEIVKDKPDYPAAAAYVKIKAELERPAAENPNVGPWKARLGLETYKVAQKDKGHYTLIQNVGSNDSADVQSRLARLENAFQSFYYWFALNGHAADIQIPRQRLLSILIGQSEKAEFSRVHQVFDKPQLVADGFFARRDNLVILSNMRRDEPYENLRNYTEPVFKGEDTSVLFTKKGQNAQNTEAQILALMLRSLEEDGELATCSHEGPRQLLAASGLLPRNVDVPQWTMFGMGSFFGTPNASPWPTLGRTPVSLVDNSNYLYTYKTWFKTKKLDEPKVALQRTITDEYFRQAKKDKDPAALLKARTMSWALTYYLAKSKLDKLLRYYQELSSLPRDLEFDDDVLARAFARAFDLIDTRNPDRVDQAKFGQFAQDWERYMQQRTQLEVEKAIKQVHAATPKPVIPTQQQQQPGFGPNLGGFPGAAGVGGPRGQQ
jgi:hypothetical protein